MVSLVPAYCTSEVAGPEETKKLAVERPPPDSDPFSDGEFEKIMPAGQAKKVSSRLQTETDCAIFPLIQTVWK